LGNSTFGNQNFVGQWNWFKSATPPNLSSKIKKNLEYILGWEKEKNNVKYSGVKKTSKSTDPLTKPQNTYKTLIFPPNSIIFKSLNDQTIPMGIYGTDKFPNELLNDLIIINNTNQNEVSFNNRFTWEQEYLMNQLEKNTKIYCSKDIVISYKKEDYANEAPPNLIDSSVNVTTTEESGKDLTNIFNEHVFDYPKPVDLLEYLIQFRNIEYVIDYFAGSGTTGHATINLNRNDGEKRKYILVEMGNYFNKVTKPRIQKVVYTNNWINGKPQDKDGISQFVKYQILESYEDTLNNLFLQRKTELEFSGKAKEEYLLQYMLEMESREHLFNLEIFRKPFEYQLKVTENNELKSTKVDLVETFNYLIGLYVNKVQRVKDIKVVEGVTRTGVKTLVIWRDLETTTHDEVEKLLRRFYDSQRTKEFQQIYINGDHHLENLRSEGDSFKIKLIEETFFKKMFNETEL
jgi:adenine-specific DNA-methyltransferase